ncbi:MAG: DUF2884 family protein [Dokdonella sp.]|uniref:DUF2884 family protein n=1 Tax=Dokdonella sp. TaxID=2291710 RepID=UPI002BD5490E|nr:DUF2884 family protein [Dokdonella sp.]HOX70714.1 DUF2884 family protein [Dokdonella sp.]HPG93700.1 DUF2884 family protein [Dokdonella sp.]HPN78835.1 DUF2884 family protein [Dokdonella sp.]
MKLRPLPSFIVLALALAIDPAFARIQIDGDQCDVDSNYATKIDAQRITFTNDKTHSVVSLLPGGMLEVDGRALALGASDRAHAAELEHAIRAIVPEAKALAVDAVAVAFEAVGHVSTAFATDGHQARESAERIARTAEELKRSINARDDWGPRSEQEIGRLIEGSVGSLIGEMVGNITAQAIKVALSGDEAAVAELEARAESIEKNVEKAVEKHAKELERRADALCERARELDRIESRISARLPDGSSIDLVQVKR